MRRKPGAPAVRQTGQVPLQGKRRILETARSAHALCYLWTQARALVLQRLMRVLLWPLDPSMLEVLPWALLMCWRSGAASTVTKSLKIV